MSAIYKTKIKSTGIYLPQKKITNFDLEKMVDTNDQWIFERTGIRERRISSKDGGEWPTDMAAAATKDALASAGMEANELDMIIFATCTGDYKLPNCASVLQQKLGMTNNCVAFDVAAACTGFVYATNMANSFIQSGMAKNILVVGAESLSTQVDWTDRSMCILFGDGAGVAILGRAQEGEESEILATTLGADGKGAEFFDQPVGGSAEPITTHHLENNLQFMRMKGREMFKVATRTLADSARVVLGEAGLSQDQLDWVVPHQANVRIIETTAKLLDMPMDKMIVNIDKYGNTSAATVPIAFHEAVTDGRIKRGQTVLFDSFGAGLTYGATLLRY